MSWGIPACQADSLVRAPPCSWLGTKARKMAIVEMFGFRLHCHLTLCSICITLPKRRFQIWSSNCAGEILQNGEASWLINLDFFFDRIPWGALMHLTPQHEAVNPVAVKKIESMRFFKERSQLLKWSRTAWSYFTLTCRFLVEEDR